METIRRSLQQKQESYPPNGLVREAAEVYRLLVSHHPKDTEPGLRREDLVAAQGASRHVDSEAHHYLTVAVPLFDSRGRFWTF